MTNDEKIMLFSVYEKLKNPRIESRNKAIEYAIEILFYILSKDAIWKFEPRFMSNED